jgi:hypothetical protein
MITGDLLTYRDPEERDISDIPSGWGAGFGASFEEGFQSSWGPLAWRFTRRQFMDSADEADPAQMALRTTLQATPLVAPFVAAARASVEGDTPMLSADEANEAFGIGDLKFKGPISLERAQDLYETNRARLEREQVIARSSVGMAGRFIGALGGSALDPVNIASGILPASVLMRTGLAQGSSFTASTFGQRLGYAAAEGAIGSAALAPGTLLMSSLENRPYSVADALLDVAFGTILTAGLHTTIGAFSDWTARGKEMPAISQAMQDATQETRVQVVRGPLANLQDGRPVNIAPIVATEVENFITAYHGSPHQFDAFKMEAMGTGEGAQAFGWGLYFAENEAVAKNYRDALAYKDTVRQFRSQIADDADFDEVREMMEGGAFTPDKMRVLEALEKDDWLGFDYPAQAITAAYRNLDNYDPSDELREALKASGHMYQVRIRADKDAMLDWDKPLSEQGAVVNTLARHMHANGDDGVVRLAALINGTDGTGKGLYQALAKEMGADKASQMLNVAGIPGIKFLDAKSRKAGDGARNFVIFDDKLIGIETRNGQSIEAARTQIAHENLQPYADPADVAVSREADEALQPAPSRARSDEQGIGAVTPETRELDAIAAEVDAELAAMKQSGALTKGDETALADADALVKQAEIETKARDYAAICLSGVDITPVDVAKAAT